MSTALALVAVLLLVGGCGPQLRWFRSTVVRRRWRRQAHAGRAELPTLIDAVAAALGSGLSLPLAFAEVAPTLRPELASPTRRAASALALGATISQAFGAY